jgi:DNA repair protein RadC
MSQILSAHTAFQLLKNNFNSETEEVWVLALNSQLICKKFELISRGTLNYCPAHPRDIFREAIRCNAHAIILAHNHPTYDVRPTPKDVVLTKRLLRASRLIEIELLDHVIFTDLSYYSFKENGLL